MAVLSALRHPAGSLVPEVDPRTPVAAAADVEPSDTVSRKDDASFERHFATPVIDANHDEVIDLLAEQPMRATVRPASPASRADGRAATEPQAAASRLGLLLCPLAIGHRDADCGVGTVAR